MYFHLFNSSNFHIWLNIYVKANILRTGVDVKTKARDFDKILFMSAKMKQLETMEAMFMALADKTRLRLLNLLRRDEVCVCFFTEVLGESQPKISRHLAYLRKAGLVRTRREGKWMHYEIVEPEDPHAGSVLNDTLDWLESQDEMKREHEQLVSICCSPNVPVTIARAPKPETIVEQAQPAVSETKSEIETFLL